MNVFSKSLSGWCREHFNGFGKRRKLEAMLRTTQQLLFEVSVDIHELREKLTKELRSKCYPYPCAVCLAVASW